MTIEFLENCVKHLHPQVAQSLFDQIMADGVLKTKLEKGRIKPIKDFIRSQLKLDELGAGASTSMIKFWTYRGWTEAEAAINVKERYDKVDNTLSSPFSRTARQYEGLTEKEIDLAIAQRRPSNKAYWLAKGFSEDEAIIKVAEFQQKGARAAAKAIRGREDHTTSQVGYWLKRGYSQEDAEKKVKSYQNTRGIGARVRKYGIEAGVAEYLARLKNPEKAGEFARKALEQWRKAGSNPDVELFVEAAEALYTARKLKVD